MKTDSTLFSETFTKIQFYTSAFCPWSLGSDLDVPTLTAFYAWEIGFLFLHTSIHDSKYSRIEVLVSMQGHVTIRGPQHAMQLHSQVLTL